VATALPKLLQHQHLPSVVLCITNNHYKQFVVGQFPHLLQPQHFFVEVLVGHLVLAVG
jgi:hypothetical protein